MRRFLFWVTYLIPILILSGFWILYETAKDMIYSYYDWVSKAYDNSEL